jgi:NhaP-type Na+/H+ or K+/H+ antiporter
MLFALFVLKSSVDQSELIFDIAAFTILCSIVAHGLTDTVGARWIERRMRGRGDEEPEESPEDVPGKLLG